MRIDLHVHTSRYSSCGHATPEEMAQAGERAWRKIWNTADFGKIRVGLSAHLEGRREELRGEAGLFNPVAISNLLGVVPPLANYALRVLTRTLQALNLPAEILANAVFQLLEDVDMAEVGGLVDALATFVSALHRGNLVLGRDEPRFKEVLGREVAPADMGPAYADYFPQFIQRGVEAELLDERLQQFDLARLGAALKAERDQQFDYLGLQTLYDRYFCLLYTSPSPRDS